MITNHARPYAILTVVEPARNVTDRDGDPRLRFRVWRAGKLAGEHWFNAGTADPAEVAAVAGEHGRIAAEAAEHGETWLVEVYDPGRPPEHAYTRWGTDQDGMTDPAEVPHRDLTSAVLGLYDSLGLAEEPPPAYRRRRPEGDGGRR
jgi:hypothetical protein